MTTIYVLEFQALNDEEAGAAGWFANAARHEIDTAYHHESADIDVDTEFFFYEIEVPDPIWEGRNSEGGAQTLDDAIEGIIWPGDDTKPHHGRPFYRREVVRVPEPKRKKIVIEVRFGNAAMQNLDQARRAIMRAIAHWDDEFSQFDRSGLWTHNREFRMVPILDANGQQVGQIDAMEVES